MDGERDKHQVERFEELLDALDEIARDFNDVYCGLPKHHIWREKMHDVIGAWQARASLLSAQPSDALTTQQAQGVTEDELRQMIFDALPDSIDVDVPHCTQAENFAQRVARALIAAGVIRGCDV